MKTLPQIITWVLGDQCYYWSKVWSGKSTDVIMWESKLLAKRYPYHQMKLGYMYSSMRMFGKWLQEQGHYLEYYSLSDPESEYNLEQYIEHLWEAGVREIRMFPLASQEHDVIETINRQGITVSWYSEQAFLTHPEVKNRYFKDQDTFSFLPFYRAQRRGLDILMNKDGSPIGGKWTYDAENRKSLPKGIALPKWNVKHNQTTQKVIDRVGLDIQEYFFDHPGKMPYMRYPVSRLEMLKWLNIFLNTRLSQFGTYEDAIDKDNHTLFHSVLSAGLNNGLIHPQEVVDQALTHYHDHKDEVSLNQIEGFIRQIIGWREYIKNIYDVRGQQMIESNHFGFDRSIPDIFWIGKTGILPVDQTINKILDTGYAHHIERLMILGNFMLLCEFNPREVLSWFQTLFVDAYPWVMIPNVMGMSQFADGGSMMTKPYISSSNYIRKMSNYEPDGYWERVWDGLYWRFIITHQDILKMNPRMTLMIGQWNRKSQAQKQKLIRDAEAFLERI